MLICKGDIQFKLITSSTKEYNNEELLKYNTTEICKYLITFQPDIINLEGLSFGSISGSKDIIAGNFWHLRCALTDYFPKTQLNIVPVLTWRSPLFTKIDRVLMKEYKEKLKRLEHEFNLQFEEELKTLKKNSKELKEYKKIITKAKKEFNIINKDLILLNNIKEQTYLKLPRTVKLIIDDFPQGKYDLTDAYFLANHI